MKPKMQCTSDMEEKATEENNPFLHTCPHEHTDRCRLYGTGANGLLQDPTCIACREGVRCTEPQRDGILWPTRPWGLFAG